MGQLDNALADAERAIELHAGPNQRTNFATLIYKLGRKTEAREQLQIVLKHDPYYVFAHAQLADWLEADAPEEALAHREQAVKYAPHDEYLSIYSASLSALQEKLGRHAAAIRTLRQMIALEPTSPNVKTWKERIARLRQALDAEERTRSTRERLQAQGELPLPTLAHAWLRAAGLNVERGSTTWLLAKWGSGQPGDLALVILPEPTVTASALSEALVSTPLEMNRARQVFILTAAETLTQDARYQLAAWRDSRTVALVTALEVRDALLQSDRDCRLLLDNAVRRAKETTDPFAYKSIVREQTEFFGRRAELDELLALVGRGQQVGLYGVHKIGKSSLLEQLRRKLHLSYPEMTVIMLEMEASFKEAGDFYRAVLEKLPGVNDLAETRMLSTAAFRQALTAFHHRMERQRPGHRILIIVDEYPYLIPDRQGKLGLNNFIEVLGILKTLHQEGWLLLLPCGRTAALSRQASWGAEENPFLDLLHTQFLGPLSREENDDLMKTLGVHAGISFTAEALELVYAETGGHPSFSRSLGSQILKIAPKSIEAIHATTVAKAVAATLADRDERTVLLAIYEDRMEEDEQQIAKMLALDGPQPRKALFPQTAAEKERRQIRDALANLIDTNVLYEQSDGGIAHRYGLLRKSIQQEQEDLGYG